MDCQKKKIVLFDFDGVIADSFSVIFKIKKTTNPKIGKEADFRRLFDKSSNDWPKVFSYNNKGLKIIDKIFFDIYARLVEKVKIFPGMKKAIAELSEKYVLLIVSSNLLDHIRDFLKRYDLLSYFDDIVGINFADQEKTDEFKMIFKKYAAESDDCVFVTDTLCDIKEAANAGIDSIGVSWGFQKEENLKKGKPFGIAEKPEELPTIISEYFKEKCLKK